MNSIIEITLGIIGTIAIVTAFSLCYYGLYALLNIKCILSKRKRVKELPDMSERDFLKAIKIKLGVSNEYAVKKRKFLSRQMWIPVDKILPDFRIVDVKNCLEGIIFKHKSDELISDLIDDLYYSKRFSETEAKKLVIETVTDYIYYSAVLDGIIESSQNLVMNRDD